MADSSNGWELSVTRHIEASPDVVWHAMSDRMSEWFGPKPWRYEVVDSPFPK